MDGVDVSKLSGLLADILNRVKSLEVETGFNREESAIREVIISARVVQTFLRGESNGAWGLEEWRRMLRKRVAKLDSISDPWL